MSSGWIRVVGLVLVTLFAWPLVGCSSVARSTVFVVEASHYDEAFEAAKDTVRSFGFELDRVDARGGVLTSRPRRSSGLATPWIPHASDLTGSWEDLLHGDARTVTVEFRPQAGAGPVRLRRDPRYDVREHAGQVQVRVEVVLEREQRPGLRADPTSVRFLSSTTPNNENTHADMFISIGRDMPLAGRIAVAVQKRLSRSG
ncbi:MAG: hypothetical protein KDA20_11720 [Phycisphaerales bacterium]|nr:hypothetical protein [Phycisphaerales bacterium]